MPTGTSEFGFATLKVHAEGGRYMQAAFCTWYSTGGEISGLLTQLPLSDLNATGTYTGSTGTRYTCIGLDKSLMTGTGVMFEKFNATDTDAAGGGGEYTVQIGFGWTNGVGESELHFSAFLLLSNIRLWLALSQRRV
jgi:hypothetical protein